MKNSITDAVKNKVCESWLGRVSGYETPLQMLKLFVDEPQVQEYCLQNNYPAISDLEQLSDIATSFGIYINRSVTLLNPGPVFLFGDTVAKIIYTGYATGRITVCHTSFVNVVAHQKAIALVQMYDEAECLIKTTGKARVKTFKKLRVWPI